MEDDELFMADSSPSKPEEFSSSANQLQSYSHLFSTSNSKTRLVAYQMLKSLLRRVLFRFKAQIRLRKLDGFLRWHYSRISPTPLSIDSAKFSAMLTNFTVYLKFVLKKALFSWAKFNKNPTIQKRFDSNKARREEAHYLLLNQMNKSLSAILNKHSELEKSIAGLNSKEKGYKEALEELNKLSFVPEVDLTSQKAILKELESENQVLRDKLEAVENNVSGFIKEMSELLESEEDNLTPSDDDGLGDAQARSTRKKRSNLLR